MDNTNDNSIPEEIKKQIEQQVGEILITTNGSWVDMITEGAEFGYSLNSKALSDALKENEKILKHYRSEVIRRNMIIEKLVKTGVMLMDGNKEAQENEWVSYQATYNL